MSRAYSVTFEIEVAVPEAVDREDALAQAYFMVDGGRLDDYIVSEDAEESAVKGR